MRIFNFLLKLVALGCELAISSLRIITLFGGLYFTISMIYYFVLRQDFVLSFYSMLCAGFLLYINKEMH